MTGTGVAAVWSEIKHGAEQVQAYGPVHQLKDMAKQKIRTILRNNLLSVGKNVDKHAGVLSMCPIISLRWAPVTSVCHLETWPTMAFSLQARVRRIHSTAPLCTQAPIALGDHQILSILSVSVA